MRANRPLQAKKEYFRYTPVPWRYIRTDATLQMAKYCKMCLPGDHGNIKMTFEFVELPGGLDSIDFISFPWTPRLCDGSRNIPLLQ